MSALAHDRGISILVGLAVTSCGVLGSPHWKHPHLRVQGSTPVSMDAQGQFQLFRQQERTVTENSAAVSKDAQGQFSPTQSTHQVLPVQHDGTVARTGTRFASTIEMIDGTPEMSARKYQMDQSPSVRIILTQQCGVYDAMTAIFANNTRTVLGNVPITFLQSCSRKLHPHNTFATLPQYFKDAGVDEFHVYQDEDDWRTTGGFRYQRSYPWIARPYAISKYLKHHIPIEDVLVIAEYDWIWLNPTKFWEMARKAGPNKAAGADYSYLQEGIVNPETIAPKGVSPTDISVSRKLLERYGSELQPVGVPLFIRPADLKKIVGRWLFLTDDLLTAQDKGGIENDRVTEMYAYILAATEAGIVHEEETVQFSPGFDTDDPKPLFGHTCYPFYLCGRMFDKWQMFGLSDNLTKNCEGLSQYAPPSDRDVSKCPYGDTVHDAGFSPLPKQLSLKVWQTMYWVAQDVCKIGQSNKFLGEQPWKSNFQKWFHA